MGEQRILSSSDQQAFRRFMHGVLRDLRALELLLEGGHVESGISRLGVEQELCLIDRYWRPAPIIQEVLRELNDPHFTTELAKFNLEFNLDPIEFHGSCFTLLEQDLQNHLDKLAGVLAQFDAGYVLTGILPTIRNMDVEGDNMTPMLRYKLLFDSLKRVRGGPFEYQIQGTDELITRQEYPTFEYCNTSFQVHIQVDPEEFVDAYNYARLITAPVLAAATNSPMLFGKKLWMETRIALFQQAVDTRHFSHHLRRNRGRVSFSGDWIQDSPLDVFRDDISHFRALLCSAETEDSLAMVRNGEIPALRHLAVFNGTVYRWNRACFGRSNGTFHLRIENRVIPSGPTVADQVANAAFWLGLMRKIPQSYRDLPDKLEFDKAVINFNRAARMGLDTTFEWLDGKQPTAQELILEELLPMCREGLESAGVDSTDTDRLLAIIEERVRRRRSGAHWIVESYDALRRSVSPGEALVGVTSTMVRRQQSGSPVHTWPTANMSEGANWMDQYWRVEQIMSTELYTVDENDLVDLVANIMSWKQIRHVPIENNRGELVGLITSGLVLNYYTKGDQGEFPPARDIMIRNPRAIPPETPVLEAISMMLSEKIGCLPVVKQGKLVGIVTEHDFVKITGKLLNRPAGTQS